MNKATSKQYLIGDSVLVKIDNKLIAGTLIAMNLDGSYCFSPKAWENSTNISVDQIVDFTYTKGRTLAINIPKDVECIVDNYILDGDIYMVKITRITGKAD